MRMGGRGQEAQEVGVDGTKLASGRSVVLEGVNRLLGESWDLKTRAKCHFGKKLTSAPSDAGRQHAMLVRDDLNDPRAQVQVQEARRSWNGHENASRSIIRDDEFQMYQQ